MRKLLPIIFLLVLACSPQKRLDRLIKNHPELLAKDTVKITDTLQVPAIEIDTIINPIPVPMVPQNRADAIKMLHALRLIYGDSIVVTTPEVKTKSYSCPMGAYT